MVRVVILCGGGGTRLFPLSRLSFPKQFLEIDGETLLGRTLKRALSVVDDRDIIVSTNKAYEFIVKDIVGESIKVVCEPYIKNTAAAFLLSIKYGVDKCGFSYDDVFIFMPSDHDIRPVNVFAEDVSKAAELARRYNKIVLIGIKPSGPETGYGYIEVAKGIDSAYEINRFVEKPDKTKAVEFVKSGSYYWNSGIYIARASLLLDELKKHSPEYANFVDMEYSALIDGFGEIPEKSIDYALAEKTKNIIMLPARFKWNDIGSWEAFFDLFSKDENENVIVSDAYVKDSKGCCILSSDRLCVVLGMEDAIVVDTKDVIFVGKKGKSQEIKEIVSDLKKMGREEVFEHTKVYRPWGYYEVLLGADRFKVKKIYVKPGKRLSLQMHHHRAEHWVVVRGTARVVLGDKEFFVHEDESIYVGKSVIHRIENVGKIPLEIVEVQTGEYLGEDDIVRIEDDYQRETLSDTDKTEK